jgi:hypothetical protein
MEEMESFRVTFVKQLPLTGFRKITVLASPEIKRPRYAPHLSGSAAPARA